MDSGDYTNKTCYICEETKPLNEFYRHPTSKGGHEGRCKRCVAQYGKELIARKKNDPAWVERELVRRRLYQRVYRAANGVPPLTTEQKTEQKRRYREQHPEKSRCHEILAYAIRHGHIKRGTCEVCGSTETHGHHESYQRPLDVNWLCVRHHHDRHLQINAERRQAAKLLKPAATTF
jgi:hypothetical protein